MSEAASNDVPGTEPTLGAEATTLTLGARLAAERMAKEWSIELVASQLNLAARQIQALETDNYAALPGMASVRGFVRAYAKLLKVDAVPLVAMIASEQITPTQPLEPKRHLAAAPFSDNRLMSADHRRSSPKAILVAIILVLLACGAIVVERMGGFPTLSQSLSEQFKDLSNASATASTTNTNAQVSTTENLGANPAASAPESASASASNPEPNSPPTAAPVVDQSATQVVTPVAAPNVAPISVATTAPVATRQNNVPVITTTAKAIEPAPEKAPVAKGLLVLKVRQDSWVEVRAGKNALLSRLVRAGSTEQVEITEAASLTLGNAAGVDASFRGNPIDIKAEAKNNVVHLSLK